MMSNQEIAVVVVLARKIPRLHKDHTPDLALTEVYYPNKHYYHLQHAKPNYGGIFPQPFLLFQSGRRPGKSSGLRVKRRHQAPSHRTPHLLFS